MGSDNPWAGLMCSRLYGNLLLDRTRSPLLPHDEMMYDEFNSVVLVIKTVASYALLYLFISMFSLSHVSFTCCRESGSNTSASVVRWWLVM